MPCSRSAFPQSRHRTGLCQRVLEQSLQQSPVSRKYRRGSRVPEMSNFSSSTTVLTPLGLLCGLGLKHSKQPQEAASWKGLSAVFHNSSASLRCQSTCWTAKNPHHNSFVRGKQNSFCYPKPVLNWPEIKDHTAPWISHLPLSKLHCANSRISGHWWIIARGDAKVTFFTIMDHKSKHRCYVGTKNLQQPWHCLEITIHQN